MNFHDNGCARKFPPAHAQHATHVRVEVDVVLHDGPYSFDEQLVYPLDQEVAMKKGDSVLRPRHRPGLQLSAARPVLRPHSSPRVPCSPDRTRRVESAH
jgi:hypothetical protein